MMDLLMMVRISGSLLCVLVQRDLEFWTMFVSWYSKYRGALYAHFSNGFSKALRGLSSGAFHFFFIHGERYFPMHASPFR